MLIAGVVLMVVAAVGTPAVGYATSSPCSFICDLSGPIAIVTVGGVIGLVGLVLTIAGIAQLVDVGARRGTLTRRRQELRRAGGAVSASSRVEGLVIEL